MKANNEMKTHPWKFEFPHVAGDILEVTANLAMDWLRGEHRTYDPRNDAHYWRNQWQLHTAMAARCEAKLDELGIRVPNAGSEALT